MIFLWLAKELTTYCVIKTFLHVVFPFPVVRQYHRSPFLPTPQIDLPLLRVQDGDDHVMVPSWQGEPTEEELNTKPKQFSHNPVSGRLSSVLVAHQVCE